MLKHLSAIVLTVLLAACAGAPPAPAPPQTPEQELRARVTAYFDALIAQDYKAAYQFFTPGYRSTWSATDHYQIRPVIGTWLSAEVLGVECVSEHACDVTVATRFRFAQGVVPLGGQEIPMDQKYRWLYTEGDWYHLPR